MNKPRLLLIVGSIATRIVDRKIVDKVQMDPTVPNMKEHLEHFRVHGITEEDRPRDERVFARIVRELLGEGPQPQPA